MGRSGGHGASYTAATPLFRRFADINNFMKLVFDKTAAPIVLTYQQLPGTQGNLELFLKLPAGNYILTDVWTGKQYSFGVETEFKLPVHGSMLLAVSKTDDFQVFDANIRLEKISATENEISFAVDYKADAELFLNRKPSRISCNGAALEFTQNGNITCFHLPEKGTLTIGF
jgi:hypothetical protein